MEKEPTSSVNNNPSPEMEKGLNNDEIAQEMGKEAVESTMEAAERSKGPKAIEDIRERETENSYTQEDIKNIAEATGRAESDSEVIKLNLALKYDQYKKYKAFWDDKQAKNEFVQEGMRQDIATAKNELEEAMYLYDPKFAKYDEEKRRDGLRYDSKRESLKNRILETQDLEERSRLREQFKNEFSDNKEREYSLNKKVGDESESVSAVESRLENITNPIKRTEIYQTYELNNKVHPDISDRRQDGRVADGDPVLVPHKSEVRQSIINEELESDELIIEAPIETNEIPAIDSVEPAGVIDTPVEVLPPAPEKNPEEQKDENEELNEQYKQAQENFAEALAKRRGIFGGGFGHAEVLEKAKDDYVKLSAELLASKYDAKINELDGRSELSIEEKTEQLNADAIKNKLDQDFELNGKIKNQIENGNLFRKIFSSIDRLPKVLRPFARAAGSNGVGTLAWAGAVAIGVANPVVGAAIAVGTVAAFTRPGYGGSSFEAHKDVLSAASDKENSIVVENGLARKEGESRDDYLNRLEVASKDFNQRSKERRAIQGLAEKESMQNSVESIENIRDKDEVTRAFTGMSDYLGKEQIELSNYDKNKNRITTGVLSVLAGALSVSNLHWGKMAVGRFGGAANYNRINMKLSSENQQAENIVVDNEPAVSVESESLPVTNTPEEEPQILDIPEVDATVEEVPELSESQPLEEIGPEVVEENIPPADQQSGSSEFGSSAAPEFNKVPERVYSKEQYDQVVSGLRTFRDSRGNEPAYASSIAIQKNLGVGVRIADEILAQLRVDGVIDGSRRIR
jgi:hypothetical protein